jgi:type VI secretion system secreted protein VgrG
MALLGQDTSVSGPDVLFLLETFQGREALGTPYRYDLTLLSDNPAIPIDKVLGQPLTVSIKLYTGELRHFTGIVTYFAKLGLSMRHVRYAVALRPRLGLFEYTSNCRIFNDPTNFDPDPEAKAPSQDAIQIVTQVLKDRDFTDVADSTKENHVDCDRRYCVQYRETDLNFVQRLLEEEGIYYFFKHDAQKHTMVLADSIAAHSKVTGYESVLYLPKQRRQQREEEHFWSLSVAGLLYPGKYSVLRGYDHTQTRPKQPPIEDKLTSHEAPGSKFEEYDYPGGLQEKAQAAADAEVRMQACQVAGTLIEVEGNTMGLGVGDLVGLHRSLEDMEHHPFWSDADFNKEYLITSATYSISINQYETGEAGASDEPFKVRLTLLDSHGQYRPPRTAFKPRIEGPQTAVVVGPSNDSSDSKEEIYTDKLGRVKVKFDWDRSPGRNQKSSCWVRVAQVWAGQQWGAMHIPRVGQEVIVEFLDGDPDRPIITGRIYNADNMPPYTLPDNRTQSGIKSRSSKGGTDKNFNEIRFEDLKGKEELHIQAERDMSTHVKRNQTITVDGDSSITVTGNQSTTVSGKGESPIHSTTKITGKHDLDVSDTIHIKAPTSITFECPGSKIEMLPGKITLTAGDGAQIVLDANALIKSSAGAKSVYDDHVLHKSKTGAQIVLDDNVLAKSVPGAKLVLDTNVEVKSVPGSKLALDTDATLSGTAAATVKAPSGVTVSGGGGTVKADPAGVAASGAKVDVSGSAMVTIAGALVKIN